MNDINKILKYKFVLDNRVSLTTRLVLLVVLAITIWMVLSALVINYKESQNLADEMSKQADILAQIVGNNFHKLLLNRYYYLKFLREISIELQDKNNIPILQIYDNNYNLLVKSPSNSPIINKTLLDSTAKQQSSYLFTPEKINSKYYLTLYPVRTKNKHTIAFIAIFNNVANLNYNLTNILSNNIMHIYQFYYNDLTHLQHSIDTLTRSKDVKNIAVYDSKLSFISGSKSAQLYIPNIKSKLHKVLNENIHWKGVIDNPNLSVYTCIMPIYNERWSEKPNGVVMVNMDLKVLENQVNSTRDTILLFTILTTLFTSLIIFFILRTYVALPLEKLTHHTNLIAKGDYVQRVEIISPNEFSLLASAFNIMTQALEEKEEKLLDMNQKLQDYNKQLEVKNIQLRDYQNELENRVRQRTNELQTTQAELLQANHLAAIGELAASVAHELNNPMGIILLSAEFILEDTASQSVEYTHLKSITREALRCKHFIKQLLNFSRPTQPQYTFFHWKKLSSNLELHFNSKLASKKIKFHWEVSPSSLNIRADIDQLEQVFINLTSNAIQAMNGEGDIYYNFKKYNKNIEIHIRDTGAGIPEEIISKLFVPFFTTKKLGTGLGLAICEKIIIAHKGEIKVESKLDEGTTFIINLPF